jgi:hypothetical protein
MILSISKRKNCFTDTSKSHISCPSNHSKAFVSFPFVAVVPFVNHLVFPEMVLYLSLELSLRHWVWLSQKGFAMLGKSFVVKFEVTAAAFIFNEGNAKSIPKISGEWLAISNLNPFCFLATLYNVKPVENFFQIEK